MAADELDSEPRHQLEGRDGIAERFAHPREQGEGGCGRGQRRKCGGGGRGPREQSQGRGRHDAQSPLGADEQLLEVVARVVLAKAGELVEHATVRQHHLESQDQRAHHAVAEHGRSAGIGGDDAAQRRAAFGAERHRQQPTSGIGGGLQLGEHATCLGGHRVARGVDCADAAQAPERHQDLVARRPRRCATAVTRVAALWHDRDALARAEPDERGHACRRVRESDQRRRPAMQAAEIGFKRSAVGGRVQPSARPQDLPERAYRSGRHRLRGAGHASHLTERRATPPESRRIRPWVAPAGPRCVPRAADGS